MYSIGLVSVLLFLILDSGGLTVLKNVKLLMYPYHSNQEYLYIIMLSSKVEDCFHSLVGRLINLW